MPRRQSTPSSIIGLSLGETETQAVELSREGLALTLHAIAEWHGGATEDPASVVQRLMSFITANSVPSHRVAVTLGTSALFTHVLPVPAGQNDALLHKHARWDIAQFFPDLPEAGFISDVHLLDERNNEGTTRALSVSVRRDVARAIQHALEDQGLELHVLDGDHFSAEHYLTTRYRDGSTGCLLLMGLKRDRMDMSILRDGKLVDYSAWTECTPESCRAKIAESTDAYRQIRKVLLYGSRATPATIASLNSPAQADIEVLNPFAGMHLAPRNPLADHFLTMPHRFVPAVGAALREE